MGDYTKAKVLFLCTGNSARSLLAEALLRHLAGDEYEAFSAGTDPQGVNPLTLAVLEEAGVSTAGLRSKHLREYLGHSLFAHVVVVCAHAAETCPTTWPGPATTHRLFFDDPAAATGTDAERRAEFRRIRDEIRAALERWIAQQRGAVHAAPKTSGAKENA